MPKVYSWHPLELRADTNPEEFEQFIHTEMADYTAALPGWKATLLKCVRGEREGQYTVLLEADSEEVLYRTVPRSGPPAAEVARIFEQYAPTFEKMAGFVVDFPDPRASDHVVVNP